MSTIHVTIDGKVVSVSSGQSVLDAARQIGIDIPTLCYLEKCGPLNSCLVCLVKINGKLVPSCGTKAAPEMVVESETAEVHEARRTALELLLSDHVGDCLSPCQRLCPLQLNIPLLLRQVKTGQMTAASQTIRNALPLPAVLGRLCHHPCEQGCRRNTWDSSVAIRDLEQRFADEDLASASPVVPWRMPPSGKSVVIIGAGPAGLAAAYYLLRDGHRCTIVDRNSRAGGALLAALSEEKLPAEILQAEIDRLIQLGAQFKFGISLGKDLTFEGLLRGFDTVLVAVGEISRLEGESLALDMTKTGIKVDADTYQTNRAGVFAAGRAVKPMNQLVRAMADGQSAAQCINQFLSGKRIRPGEKPFSSIMGRLSQEELHEFLSNADLIDRLDACDISCSFSDKEARTEAGRCLHCDCHASGNCALQSYAQQYGADPGRYRQQRRSFEQYQFGNGIRFEPGKCIRCGICVKLTELANEPLGLAFAGRGFDVRVSAPFDQTFQAGLGNAAQECVEACPTGAITFVNGKPLAACESGSA